MKFTTEVTDFLKAYVYVYFDPRNNLPFYVGKGRGNRIFDHFKEQSESEKVLRIKEIKEAGLEPRIEILRYGLSDEEAGLVEAATIDLLLGLATLTNVQRGEHSKSYGRVSSKEISYYADCEACKDHASHDFDQNQQTLSQ